jgi:hypothetical protein
MTAGLWLTALVAVALMAWFVARRRIDNVPATLDLEATNAHFHAHVELNGVQIDEADTVHVHGAPTFIALNEKRTMSASATVTKASAPRRLWERVAGRTRITELYEVGFEG